MAMPATASADTPLEPLDLLETGDTPAVVVPPTSMLTGEPCRCVLELEGVGILVCRSVGKITAADDSNTCEITGTGLGVDMGASVGAGADVVMGLPSEDGGVPAVVGCGVGVIVSSSK
jgi:hypothetical protein